MPHSIDADAWRLPFHGKGRTAWGMLCGLVSGGGSGVLPQWRCLVLAFGGSLVDEVHELVELRGDDDLRAAVALLAHLGAVAGHGVVFATAGGGEALGVDTVLVLQGLHHL